jgi:presequence protease
MRKLLIISFCLSCFFLYSCKNETFPGYTLVEKKFVKEVNADCFLLEHIKSGARIFKIAADDPNKTFIIGFSTPPEDDCGTPHILEHSVLNGSQKFPVKSPLDILLKGSLNTFLNAMTSFDLTIYPVASRNEKDYFNLMNVYLDAVFNPLIYKNPNIFLQEGWHYELKSKSSTLEYKGVVYNEMKGAYSNPDRILLSGIMNTLFPETAFRFSSGGFPSDIPKLSYQRFIDFHKKYYHPAKSFIFLYGDADLEKELEFLDKNYLSGYERIDNTITMIKQQPFASEKATKLFYPVLEGDDIKDRAYLTLSWVAGSGTDGLTNTTLNILAEILINQESAPLRIALSNAGIGKEVSSMVLSGQFQNTFTITSRNANPEDTEKFRNIIFETLSKVCEKGIDKESIWGAINREEFSIREGDSQKGLLYCFRSLVGWIYSGNPLPLLEYEDYLKTLKSLADGPYFENFIKENLLSNNHRGLVILEPSPGMEQRNIEKIANDLENFKKTLSDRQLDSLVVLTKDLISYQETEDYPEALARVPMLKLSDVNPEATWYGCSVGDIKGVKNLFYDEYTNGIVYSTLWFDLRSLPMEMIPYAGVLAQMIGKLGTSELDFSKLEKAVTINTGGLNSTINVLLPDNDDDKMMPALTVNIKTTVDKIDTAMKITAKIVTSTIFNDKVRIKELLVRNHANLKASLLQDGFTASIKRFESYTSKRGIIIELTSNIEYFNFLTDLIEKYEKEPDIVISDLRNVADIIFSKGNLTAGVTCDVSDFGKYSSAFGSFVSDQVSRDQLISLQLVFNDFSRKWFTMTRIDISNPSLKKNIPVFFH